MPVVIEGVVELKKALRQLAPDIKKEMDKNVREALKPIVRDARAHVPGTAPGGLINWNNPGYERKSRTGRKQAFPSYDQTIIRRGLTYSIGNSKIDNSGFVSLFTLLNKSRQGSIIEVAGRAGGRNPKSESNNPNAGAMFIGAMNGIGGLVDYSGRGKNSTGRLLYAAYARNKGKAVNATLRSVEEAKQKLYQRVRLSRGEAA